MSRNDFGHVCTASDLPFPFSVALFSRIKAATREIRTPARWPGLPAGVLMARVLPVLAVLAFVVLGAPRAVAQHGVTEASEAGKFFIQNFEPRNYPGHAQNWAVTQGPDGIIYVGNGSGLLEFDGVSWRMVHIPTLTAVRSLVTRADGTVFAGTHGDFGYLAPDSTGSTRFVSLLPHVPEEDRRFTDVWRAIETPEGIYFSSRERLFRWSGDEEMKSWPADPMFALGFAHEGLFHTVIPGRGLVRIEKDELVDVPGGHTFSGDLAYFALPDGADGLLVGTRDRGMVRYREGRFEKFVTEADERLRSELLYHGIRLQDGTLALATRRGGVFILDRSGALLHTVDEATGLRDQQIWYSFQDDQGGLWLALNSGVARVEVASAFTSFDASSGLPGLVTSTLRHHGAIYASTSTGVYRLSTGNGRSGFETVELQNSGQCLQIISTEAGLLAACEGGIFAVEGLTSSRITRRTARGFHRMQRDPSVMLAATNEGTLSLSLRNGKWVDGEFIDEIPPWAHSFLEESGADVLWATTTSDGIHRITGLATGTPSVQRFAVDEGVPAGWTYAATLSGEPVFHTTGGLFRYDGQALIRDTLLGPHLPLPEASIFLFREADDGVVWFSNGTRFGAAYPESEGRYRIEEGRLKPLASVSLFSLDIEERILWIGTEDGLYRFDPAVRDTTPTGRSVRIRRVSTINGDSTLYGGFGHPGGSLQVPHADNSLRFAFALPSYDRAASNSYQVRLEGFDRNWSEWSTTATKDYTNLPAGTYQFRVRALDAWGNESQEGVYSFKILPAWYQTWWAILLYVIAFLLLAGGSSYRITRFRMRRLQEHTDRLEQTVKQRTETLEHANEQLRRVLEQHNEFLNIAAHDLKNPITSIIGFADILIEEETSGPQTAEFLELMRDSALRMATTISQLQDTEMLDSGTLILRPVRENLAAMIRDVLSRNEVQAAAKQIRVEFDFPTELYCDVDPDYMPRVIDNLVSNAIKYSPRGSSVQVRLGTRSGSVRLEVADQGPGLTEDDMQRVFGKLQRLSARPTGGESSTGLGLYIVHTLVNLHGGTIHVESSPGHGAAFIVHLPSSIMACQLLAEGVHDASRT
jgi:signal transduction histidine kinase